MQQAFLLPIHRALLSGTARISDRSFAPRRQRRHDVAAVGQKIDRIFGLSLRAVRDEWATERLAALPADLDLRHPAGKHFPELPYPIRDFRNALFDLLGNVNALEQAAVIA